MRTKSIAASLALLGVVALPAPRARWGANGHEMATRAALTALPADMPVFFREAAEQLVYLDPEPDRWRVTGRDEAFGAWSFDHFINLENVPEAALEARDRYAYLYAVRAAGVEEPHRVGMLPFAIAERYQRLVTEWELWRRESDPERRSWIEARIVNDAGILGHFVTDGSNPHHVTIHYNGWADGAANPEGYTRDRGFHARFEAAFVDAHVQQRDVTQRTGPAISVAHRARPAVMSFLRSTQETVEELYRLDRDVGFDPDAPPHPQTVDFAAERLAAGAQMLAVLWLSAWEESR
jgi:hypothetical protein